MANPTKTEVKPLRPNPLSEADERLAPIGEFLMGPDRRWTHYGPLAPIGTVTVAYCGHAGIVRAWDYPQSTPVTDACPDCVRMRPR